MPNLVVATAQQDATYLHHGYAHRAQQEIEYKAQYDAKQKQKQQ